MRGLGLSRRWGWRRGEDTGLTVEIEEEEGKSFGCAGRDLSLLFRRKRRRRDDARREEERTDSCCWEER